MPNELMTCSGKKVSEEFLCDYLTQVSMWLKILDERTKDGFCEAASSPSTTTTETFTLTNSEGDEVIFASVRNEEPKGPPTFPPP